jgi:CheY-like chemotaxis protein
VEDEKDQFNVFSYFLDNEFKITRAIDYEDALLKIKSDHFDLIIIDIIIPSGKKDVFTIEELRKIKDTYYGLELIKRLRNEKNSTPICVVTVVKEKAITEEITATDNSISIISKYDPDTREQIKETVSKLLY